jgi:Mor family transcriptional regulator
MMQRIVKELSDAIGIGDALEVVRRWGGREVYIPTKVEAGDPLALTLGQETARKLVTAYGGRRLQLPAERNALLDLRNEAIYRACAVDGRSQESVGLEFGLTRQAVSHVLKAYRERAELRQKFAGGAAARSSAESAANT